MKELLLVGIGGFIGSISRYLVHLFMASRFVTPFPVGTFTVNLVGSLLIGVIMGIFERYDWLTHEWRIFLAIGFCGSFTTFSTFAFENVHLLRESNYLHLLAYVSLSVILGMVLVWVGYQMAK